MDMPESQPLPDEPLQIFPRLKERDPYKVLGIDHEASFEEVQDARNFLYEQYKEHEPSRESIELAFDSILQSSIKFRNKYGFRPPKTGRRSDVSGDAEKVSIVQRVKDLFEPSVSSVTLVNEGSIFLGLALWAAWQAASSDPTLPLGGAVAFCAYKIYGTCALTLDQAIHGTPRPSPRSLSSRPSLLLAYFQNLQRSAIDAILTGRTGETVLSGVP